MANSTTLFRRGRLPEAPDDAVEMMRSAFQNDRLLQDFGSELTNLKSTVARHDENDAADVAKVQSLLFEAGKTDLKELGGPTGMYSDRHLEEPIKRFQRGHGLKVDALVKPGGPTIRKLGEVAQRGGSPSPTVAKAKDGQVAQAGPQRIFTPTRKPAPPDERAPRKQTKRVPLPGEIYLGTFKDAIAERESKSYQDVNRDLNTGKEALGRYQMTEGALQDLGLMDAGNNTNRRNS